MNPQLADRTHGAAGSNAPAVDAAVARPRRGDAQAMPGTPPPEIESMLEPMLEAVVCLAGARAGAVRLVGGAAACFEPRITVRSPAATGPADADPVAAWCRACGESRNATSECVRSDVCGHGERFAADVLGSVCKHVVAVPLRHRGHPVGTLNLMFESEQPLPATMTPLLQATGDLLGTALDNARLARENLRICLTNERHLMANEVHDSLAQGLTYMRMRMSLLRDAIRDNDAPRAQKLWDDVDDALGSSHHRLRELITYFRCQMDPRGLMQALSEVVTGFFDRTGVALEFVNRAPGLCLPPEREIEVFHIVQEALANVCRHAQAKCATLAIGRNDGACVVTVADDGIGMPEYPPGTERDVPGHYGIAIMHERARRLGGTLLYSARSPGTRLELRFPVESVLPEAPR